MTGYEEVNTVNVSARSSTLTTFTVNFNKRNNESSLKFAYLIAVSNEGHANYI